ncbi:hypothetical protein ACN9ML_05810 [Dyadobacter endophyticus]|uniref:hypothetical protein n=1 Tax=Dyadobacter TaxID=120831 RepID=UPI003CEDC332
MIELLYKYPVVGTVIGIVLGFVLTQIGMAYRARLENKKTLKTVLFHLLETYYSLDRNKPGPRLDQLVRKAMGVISGQSADEAVMEQAEVKYTRVLKSVLATRISQEIEEISKDYQESVLALSVIDPIQAYYLSRRSNIDQLFKTFSGLADQIPVQSPQERAEIQHSLSVVLDTLKPKIFEDSLRELEEDIKSIACRVGICTWIRAGKAVKRIQTSVDKNIENDLEPFLKDLMPDVIEAMQSIQPFQTVATVAQPCSQVDTEATRTTDQ